MSEKIVVKIDPEISELVPGYLENLEKSIGKLKEGLQKDDMELCRSIGHKIKGSGGSYGFAFISEMGKEIEDAARNQKDEAERNKWIKERVSQLENYMNNLEVLCA